ncbi:hypothetical protein V8E53_008331 [Lactarius tabidus]
MVVPQPDMNGKKKRKLVEDLGSEYRRVLSGAAGTAFTGLGDRQKSSQLSTLMQPKKIHIFSIITPIQPDIVTYVDLGDTGHPQPQFPSPAEQPGGVDVPMPPARDSQGTPLVDLRSLTNKRASEEPADVPGHDEKIPEVTEKQEASSGDPELGGHDAQNQRVDIAAASTVDQPVATSQSESNPLRTVVSDEGMKLFRHTSAIKRTGSVTTRWYTRWYIVLNPRAIEEPPILHSTSGLELGDLFLNQYQSASHGRDVLQVWLLKLADEGRYHWHQVSGEESSQTSHPMLPEFVLSFLPSDLSSPSWVRRNTERRRRERPRILAAGEGTFTEGV